MEKPFCSLLPHEEHRQKQAAEPHVPAHIGHELRNVGVGAHDELIDRPVVFAQKAGQEKGDEEPIAALGVLDELEDAIQKPHDRTEERQDVFNIFVCHSFVSLCVLGGFPPGGAVLCRVRSGGRSPASCACQQNRRFDMGRGNIQLDPIRLFYFPLADPVWQGADTFASALCFVSFRKSVPEVSASASVGIPCRSLLHPNHPHNNPAASDKRL